MATTTTKPQLTEADKRDMVERELRHFNLEFSQKYNKMVKILAIRLNLSIEEAERMVEDAMSLS